MRPRLSTQEKLKDLLGNYYRRLAKGDVPVAWCSSVGPAELLRSFGFEVYFPENHGALIGSRRLGSAYIPLAVSRGFSPEICSYLTSDIGSFTAAKTPLETYGIPAAPVPHLLVYNTNQCREVKDWFRFYGEQYGVPVMGIDTPRDIDYPGPALLAYLEASWRELIAGLEQVAGHPFDEDRFAEVVGLSGQACRLWSRFLESNRSRPAKHTFFDHVILMAPAVVLRGTGEAVLFYQALLEEVTGTAAGDTREDYRFYWEGMPIWGKIRFFSELFTRHHISTVCSTYCLSWLFDFNRSDALASSIKSYASIFISRSQAYKIRYLKEVVERFSIDAVLFHDARTCPYNSNTRLAMPEIFEAQTGVPCFSFYGDLVDLRHFSEDEFSLRLEAFVEQLR